MALPRQRILDYPSRLDELLILLIRLTSLQARAAGVSETEITNIISAVPGAAGPPGKLGEAGAPAVAAPMVPPIVGKIGLKMPVIYALTQELPWSHHAFRTISFTTTIGKTLVKDLDERLTNNITPDSVLVSPTQDCKIEFSTESEDVEIRSDTPPVLSGQSLLAPLSPTTIHYQGVTASGDLYCWFFWR